MRTYSEIADEVNRIYKTETELDALKKAGVELSATVKEIRAQGQYDSDIGQDTRSLLVRLKAKLYLLTYFEGGYYPDDKNAAVKYFETEAAEAKKYGWENTAATLERALSYINAVDAIMFDAAALSDSVRDRHGDILTSSMELIKDVGERFKKKREDAALLPDCREVFGQKVKLPKLNDRLISELDEVCEWCVKREDDMARRDDTVFFESHTRVPYGQEEGAPSPMYYPSVLPDSYTDANTIVLNTPFIDEAYNALAGYHADRAETMRAVTGAELGAMSGDDITRLLRVFSEKKISLIVEDIDGFRRDDCFTELARSLIALGKSGVKVFLIDCKGDRDAYDKLLGIVKDADGFSALDVSNVFLCMPAHTDFLLALSAHKLIQNGAEDANVRDKMKFAGYVGLNDIIKTALSGGSWRNVGVELSARREENAKRYLSSLPSQLRFIDLGWGEVSCGKVHDTGRRNAFDYDKVYGIDPENLKKIAENPSLTVFEKFGGAALYCTLCGMDKSVWATLPDSEREERINTATRIVAQILDTMYTPEVSILTKEEMEKLAPGAGGVCCDGGKAIKYLSTSLNNIDWVVGAICHECYHSFQHTAIDNGWKRWYFAELGVTEGRIDRWKNNFSMYVGDVNSVTYKVEVVESDAVAFEKDCSAVALKALASVDLS